MYTVFGDIYSGNCYKVALLLTLLGREFEWVRVSVLDGETQSPEFRARNPNGKIPLLEISPGEYLPESNAILNYLSEGSPYLPATGLPRARVLQWQFFEQYSHEPSIAVARFIKRYLGTPADKAEQLKQKQAAGYKALNVMEDQLNKTDFIAGHEFTIADISLHAYTHVADEGGFSLDDYPAINAWLERISHQRGYVSMAEAAMRLPGNVQ